MTPDKVAIITGGSSGIGRATAVSNRQSIHLKHYFRKTFLI
ncbi:MAG: hypothetical protein WBQ25_05335 [Nitrososphaeraceae archaeon]